MTFAMFDTIALALNAVFGGALFLPLMIILVIGLIILSIRGGKILFLIVLVPLVTTMVTFGVGSQFFAGMAVGTQWIVITGWLGLGVIMFSVFVSIMR